MMMQGDNDTDDYITAKLHYCIDNLAKSVKKHNYHIE